MLSKIVGPSMRLKNNVFTKIPIPPIESTCRPIVIYLLFSNVHFFLVSCVVVVETLGCLVKLYRLGCWVRTILLVPLARRLCFSIG